MSTQLLYNGEFYPAESSLLTTANRAFRYGDGVFESMRMIQGKLCFAPRHWQRLLSGVQLLELRLPDNFISTSLEHNCLRLAEANNISGSARIRLSVFRNAGGLYSPATNDASWMLELEPMADERYMLNEKGLSIELYQDIRKPINKLANIKSTNALLYVLAALNAKKHHVDDCALINQTGNVIEATASNLFAVKNGVLYTSPLTEGCVAGVMRSVIMEIAQTNRIAVYEVPLAMGVLLNADEVFLTNAVRGIQWVSAYKAKRYFNTTAKKLNEFLNAMI